MCTIKISEIELQGLVEEINHLRAVKRRALEVGQYEVERER